MIDNKLSISSQDVLSEIKKVAAAPNSEMDATLSSEKSVVAPSEQKSGNFLSYFMPKADSHIHINVDDSANPSFPVEVFPTKIAGILRSYCQYEGFNPDYMGASMLTVFAAAMGSHWCARATTTFITTPILYMVLVGPPSCGKTPPLDNAVKPLRSYDLYLDKVYQDEMTEYKRLYGNKKSKDDGSTSPAKPLHHQKLVMNTTVESLFGTLDKNRRGVLLCTDELDSLIGNFSRYSRGNDEPYWLQMFNGVQLKYERKTTEEYINIAHPYVSIIGGVQPSLLPELFGGRRIGNGFACRFLKVYPEINDMLSPSRERMPEKVVRNWEQIIENIIKYSDELTEDGSVVPVILGVDAEAMECLLSWAKYNNETWRNAEEEYSQGVCGKLMTYLVRFSLILQIMHSVCEGSTPTAIDKRSMEGAVKFVEYFRAMDLKVYKAVKRSPSSGWQNEFLSQLPQVFTTSEAIIIGAKAGVSESTVKRFLRYGLSVGFLSKNRHGMYSQV